VSSNLVSIHPRARLVAFSFENAPVILLQSSFVRLADLILQAVQFPNLESA